MIFKENSSKKKISTLGFGSWGLGSDSYGRINKNDSLKILNFATKKGINFIDTSNVYGKGLAEERIGEFLSKNFLLRPKLFIATKCGMLNNSSLSFSEKHDFNINNIEQSIKKSLIRLRINYIDLYSYIHHQSKYLKIKRKLIKY